MRRITIASFADIERLERVVREAAAATMVSLRDLVHHGDDVGALAEMKFKWVGHDPLAPKRPLNLVEQLNQSFTYLASCAAVRWLLLHEGEHAPYHLSLGTEPGHDIISDDQLVKAEVFAATHPGSNNKLKSDAARLEPAVGVKRFVFYLSPLASPLANINDVTIVRLDFPMWEPYVATPGA